eukprot:11259168-Karenia_brevis.AAC.1
MQLLSLLIELLAATHERAPAKLLEQERQAKTQHDWCLETCTFGHHTDPSKHWLKKWPEVLHGSHGKTEPPQAFPKLSHRNNFVTARF